MLPTNYLSVSASLVKIATSAGNILSEYFRKAQLAYSTKNGRANLVTQADLASQRLIVNKLKQSFPNIPIIAEENGKPNLLAETCFLIDPLDGTLNFFHGIPFFSVALALVVNYEPIVGVVYAPCLKETFYAIKGHGAYLNAKRLQTRENRTLKDAIAATGWPYDQTLVDLVMHSLTLVQKEVQEVRVLGACSLEMCYVAAGFIDVYWELGLFPWDLAAGSLIVSEAGGTVTDLDGSDFDLSTGRVLAAANKFLHSGAVSILTNIFNNNSALPPN